MLSGITGLLSRKIRGRSDWAQYRKMLYGVMADVSQIWSIEEESEEYGDE